MPAVVLCEARPVTTLGKAMVEAESGLVLPEAGWSWVGLATR